VETQTLNPLPLSGDWQFKPLSERVAVPYAKVRDGSKHEGDQRGWQQPTFDDSDWPSLWLSEEQNTIRDWSIIGPFPNPDNDGFAKAYPPEMGFEPDGRYQGLDGEIVQWKPYYGNEPRLNLAKSLIWMQTEGGRFSDTGYISQFDPELLTGGKSWILAYAHGYLYSPRAQKAEFIVAADNWARIWLNHRQVFEQLRQPFWYELNDHWADQVPVDLRKGWNEVLLKVGKGRSVASGFYGFTFRVADEGGQTLPGVEANLTPTDKAPETERFNQVRWYRIEIPPGCTGVFPPRLRGPYRMLVNGKELNPTDGSALDLRGSLGRDHNVLVIAADRNDRLDAPVQFQTGLTTFPLTPWMKTGLANYSGAAEYLKTVAIPDSYTTERLVLDLGRVSSVAEVYVNGDNVGSRVWRPYRLDITKFVKAGANEIRVVVYDTEANGRAVGTWHPILSKIDVCGLEGPVQIVPYVDAVVTLQVGRMSESGRTRNALTQ
jgi:hypothetical protein